MTNNKKKECDRMKDQLRKTLGGLMKKPRASDREISTDLGISQPTVSRQRAKLEEKGIIESYQVIPRLSKLGYEIVAFSLVTLDEGNNIPTDKRVIYALSCPHGIITVSVHENHTAYLAFCGEYGINKDDSMTASTLFETIKPLGFQDIEV
jgi:DNA-binding Lrp family transcriptional regulator